MSRLNKIVLVGNLDTDAQSESISTGDLKTQFKLAVERPTNENSPAQNDIITVVLWRDLAEKTATLKTGQLVLVEGSIHNRSYDNQEGQRIYLTEVEARDCKILSTTTSSATTNEPDTHPILETPQQEKPNFDFNEAIAKDNEPAFANELGEDVPF